MGDHTLFPLTFSSYSHDSSDYSERKMGYSITCFFINDENRRIWSYLFGWPVVVHDKRVFGKMCVNTSPKLKFSGAEYMIADLALEIILLWYQHLRNHHLNNYQRKIKHVIQS